MPDNEIELDPVDFITVGTIGPKGKRVFHLQAGQDQTILSFILEKQQAQSLSHAIDELLEEVEERAGPTKPVQYDMALREPIEPRFRIAQMGLGYDDSRDMVVLVIQELMVSDETIDPLLAPETPQVARLWATREQTHALGKHAAGVVKQGRADPKMNGNVVYYWL